MTKEFTETNNIGELKVADSIEKLVLKIDDREESKQEQQPLLTHEETILDDKLNVLDVIQADLVSGIQSSVVGIHAGLLEQERRKRAEALKS